MSSDTVPLAEPATARIPSDVLVRPEEFGFVAYVPRWDRFFALTGTAAAVLGALIRGRSPEPAHAEVRHRLEALGIVGTATPAAPAGAHTGESLIGGFDGVPCVTRPLVVNCFASAECPLQCRYCHADDLMRRGGSGDPERVARMARAVPALVAVVTGGEPLTRVARTAELIHALAADGKAVVLDTSGAGDLGPLLPVLRDRRVHLRVSLDSDDPLEHDRLRPVKRRSGPAGSSSWLAARQALRVAAEAGVPATVQTVVTARNESVERLTRMRDWLVGHDIRNWVLHVVAPAGKAAAARNQELLTSGYVGTTLAGLLKSSVADRLPINIRVTGVRRAVNTVLLIGADGDLYVERESGGKVRVAGAGAGQDEVLRTFRSYVDPQAHAGRYLNGD